MGGCQNYGPFLGPYYNTYYLVYPKRDLNFDNHPHDYSAVTDWFQQSCA